MKGLLLCLSLFAATRMFAQTVSVKDFVIDESRPYAYLKFDHIGPRKPVQDGEGDVGIWLRVVNNCRIPISKILNSAEEEKEFEQHEQLRKMKQKPVGYSSETGGVIRVQPGKEVLFSVPLNHVDDDWYMRVKFALELNTSSISVGPFTYLPFYEWDIPKEFRPSKTSNAAH